MGKKLIKNCSFNLKVYFSINKNKTNLQDCCVAWVHFKLNNWNNRGKQYNCQKKKSLTICVLNFVTFHRPKDAP
jgi:hypothetical protein